MKTLLKNKKAFVITLALLLGVAATSTTLAMLTDTTGKVTNFFAAGDVNTSIEEELDDQPVQANTAILKQPVIVNEGPSNAFIRARVTITPSDSGVTLLAGDWSATEGADKTFSQTGTVYDGSTFCDNGNWMYCKEDGFYYFSYPIEEGAQTDAIFDAVVLTENADVTIYQEAVLAHETYPLDESVELSQIKKLFDAVTK